jgi:hypothetical protein
MQLLKFDNLQQDSQGSPRPPLGLLVTVMLVVFSLENLASFDVQPWLWGWQETEETLFRV